MVTLKLVQPQASPDGWRVRTVIAVLLAAATLALVFRVPGSVSIALLLPALAIVVGGAWRPRGVTAPLWAFLGLALVCSGCAALLDAPVMPWVNFAVLAFTFGVFAFAILGTGTEVTTTRAVMGALYYGFGTCLMIGLAEIATGFKLQTVLYPDASNLVFANRFQVAAIFPNFNDFAVVLAMFAVMCLARLLLDVYATSVARWLRAAGVLASCLVIVAIGSRGALIGVLVGAVLVVVRSMRLVRPRAISPALVVLGGLTSVTAGLALWVSPWVQDNSTTVRLRILDQTIALAPENSSQFWLGWGDLGAFSRAARLTYPDVLMDPHNVGLEVFTWFGAPTLLALTALWLWVVWRGVWRLDVRPGWVSASAVTLFALLPIMGTVPSSTLRYYYLFLLAACAVSALGRKDAEWHFHA